LAEVEFGVETEIEDVTLQPLRMGMRMEVMWQTKKV